MLRSTWRSCLFSPALLFLLTSCTIALTPRQQTVFSSLPAGMQTVVKRLPPRDQRAFLDSPQATRDAVVHQWSDRVRALSLFTPAEQALIATLPRADADAFYGLPHDRQEQFLIALVMRNTRIIAEYVRRKRGG